jgi:hypothetical protein
MSSTQPIRASLLLCDFAQVVAEKLYVLGGGWSYLWLVEDNADASVFVAIDLAVPWELGNRPLNVLIRLRTEDGDNVLVPGGEEPAEIKGQVVAGRGPLARPGAELHVPLALAFPVVKLRAIGYVCELLVDGEQVARAPFQVGLIGQGPS